MKSSTPSRPKNTGSHSYHDENDDLGNFHHDTHHRHGDLGVLSLSKNGVSRLRRSAAGRRLFICTKNKTCSIHATGITHECYTLDVYIIPPCQYRRKGSFSQKARRKTAASHGQNLNSAFQLPVAGGVSRRERPRCGSPPVASARPRRYTYDTPIPPPFWEDSGCFSASVKVAAVLYSKEHVR